MKLKSRRRGFVNRYIPGKDCCHCDLCAGFRGGVRGNNVIVDGVRLCDYCHVTPLATEHVYQLLRFNDSLLWGSEQRGLYGRAGPFPRQQFLDFLNNQVLEGFAVTPNQPPPCPQCAKNAPGDCSRAHCPRRKPITAQLASGSAAQITGGYRRPPTKRGNQS